MPPSACRQVGTVHLELIDRRTNFSCTNFGRLEFFGCSDQKTPAADPARVPGTKPGRPRSDPIVTQAPRRAENALRTEENPVPGPNTNVRQKGTGVTLVGVLVARNAFFKATPVPFSPTAPTGTGLPLQIRSGPFSNMFHSLYEETERVA
jgi:hypothetical protein